MLQARPFYPTHQLKEDEANKHSQEAGFELQTSSTELAKQEDIQLSSSIVFVSLEALLLAQ